CVYFYFQAEDGIRDATVTGVQTCALPICVLEPGHVLDGNGAHVCALAGGARAGWRGRGGLRPGGSVANLRCLFGRRTGPGASGEVGRASRGGRVSVSCWDDGCTYVGRTTT